jgi:hypothetical protein
LHLKVTVQLQEFFSDLMHSDFALQERPESQEFSLKYGNLHIFEKFMEMLVYIK